MTITKVSISIMAVVLVAYGLARFTVEASAKPPIEGGAIVGDKLTAEEKASIASLSDNELIAVVKAGTIGRRGVAISALMRKDRGDALLAIAKAGPINVSNDVIEAYVPRATADSDAKVKESVDAYLTWLEEQLKAESPVVSPQTALKGLGRVASLPMKGIRGLPNEPRMAAPYQHERVVANLIGLLKDSRPFIRVGAVRYLGMVAGYGAEQAQQAIAALNAYRETVNGQVPANKKEQSSREMSLKVIDMAVKDIMNDRALRTRFGVEGETSQDKAATTQPAATEVSNAESAPK